MRGLLLTFLFLIGAAAQAQQSTVTFSENFQSYGKSKKPAGWIDTKVGSLNAKPRGYFKTRIDPTQDKKGTNIVYGTTKSIADHDDDDSRGVATQHDDNQRKHGGYFAIYQPKVFSATGRFEVTGRLIRVSTRSRAGLTVLSGYPEKDKYYLIREESTGTANPTLRLSAFGAGTPTGKLDSQLTLAPGKWYRFRVSTDSVGAATTVRARFWLDGTEEPTTYAIEATDSSTARLTAGRFGVWAGGTDDDNEDDSRKVSADDDDDDDESSPPTRGTYVDDLNAKSPVDTGLPTIQFFENGVQLDPTKRTDFNRNAAVEIRVADELSTVTYTATLDDVAYRSLDPIATEGTHLLKVRAVDAVGNIADAQVSLLIDKTTPTIALLESGQPLADNAKFKRAAAVEINVADALSTVTYTAKLDGNAYTSLTPIAAEGAHVLLVEVTDAVGNRATKQVHIVIDLTPPTIAFFESGHAVDSSNAKFKVNPAIEIRVNDSLPTTLTATLDGAPYQSLDLIMVDGRLRLVATAVDEAGNSATQTLNLLVDKVAPVVVLLESSNVLDLTKTAIFARDAAIEVRVTDTTSQVTWSAKLDNVDYTSLTPITEEQAHTIAAHAVDETGNVTDVTLSVLIDKTAPVVSFYEGTTKLDPRADNLFRRNVAIEIIATDATSTATFTATLDGAPYHSLDPITAEGPHVIAVHAVDTAGNVTTADVELRFLVDKTNPVIVLSESGTPLPTGSQRSLNRDAKVAIAVTDNLTGVTFTAKLDGSDYTSDAPITAEGTHTLAVHAIDAAGNEADASATLLIDKSGPTVRFFENNIELLPTEPKHKFKVRPAIEIRVSDALSTATYTAKLNGVDYASLAQIPEGIHTITVHAVDALGNASDATLALLVDLTAPVVVLKEGANLLPATGGIFAHDLSITAEVTDLSDTVVTATLDDLAFSLSVPVAEEGPHTLRVTATDELAWPTTVTSTFTIDKTAPKVTVREGTTPLLDGASFARDVAITATAEDITAVQYTATLDGAPYTLGVLITADGTHTIVVTGTDAAGNRSAAQTIQFHIERSNPEVRLLESGQSFPDGKSFPRDVNFTIEVVAATATTNVVKIDGAAYTLGTPYGVEGQHHISIVVTTAGGRSTPVDADFEIDKTKPTIRLMANSASLTDDQTFSADLTPIAEANDNLTQPPVVVIILDGQTLAAGTVISEEKLHTISATATDRAGNSAIAGPLTFVLDKTNPTLTVKVDDKPLATGDKFNAAITPVIEADDLTPTTISATLDGAIYTVDTAISEDGSHTLVARATDRLGHETLLAPLTFIIDKTPPVVTVLESDAPFLSGSKYKRAVTPTVRVVDTTETIVVATLDGNVYTPGQEITSEGRHELSVLVTDELGWSTPVPTITFTIDGTEPVVEVREGANLLVTGTIFNRDVRPKIIVTDATETITEATLDGAPFLSDTLITTEGAHTLAGKVTDELGLFTPILPISFTIDKTPPVVAITEAGVPFTDNALLNHDAVPQTTITDITAVTITATLDGAPHILGTPITSEGPHTIVWSARDAAGWTTADATIRFVIDKTAPVVTITDGGAPLVSGVELGRSVIPVINITDISTTTTVATLDGALFTSGTTVAAEGSHTLAVTVTDAAGWPTTVPPITFVIDKTAPVVRVLESGQPLVSGTKFNRGVLPQIVVTDNTATTIAAKLGEATYTPDTLIETEGTLTLSITVTDRGGNITTVPPITFVIDRTPPVVTITESGQPLTSGSAFMRTVKPEIAIQDITATTLVARLNGLLFTFGTEITEERRYALSVTVTDELGWPTTVPTIGFAIDKTPPVVQLVQDGKPLTSGSIFNHAVEPRAVIDDVTDTTVTATLNGAPYVLGTKIGAEGEYTLNVRVVDAVGLSVDVPTVTFRIDTTKPVLSFITPTNQQNLVAPRVLVTGNADDAATVDVAGVAADVDLQTKRFTIPALELLEGPNTIVAIGTDAAGNVSVPVSVEVTVDTRAPEVTIASPAANACVTTRQLPVTGTIADPHVQSVSVALLPGTTTPVVATLSEDRRTWSATLPFPSEGKFVIAVTARDSGGHESVATVQVRIDETKPRIEITESGSPFAAPFVNHAIAPFVRVVDADPNATLTVTLDGAPYVSGTPIASEKNFEQYELKATATDCAGNRSDDAIVRFVIDRTLPQFLTLSPTNGSSIGNMPPVSGTVSPDTASVIVEESGVAASVANGAFTFGTLTVNEGVNRFTLVAIDRAGNRTRLDYSFTVKTSAPTVDIVENGSAIVSGTRYSRAVTVDVISNEADAVITATRNGQSFTSGTTIEDNGSHTIGATARDTFGHTSPAKEITFTIDREGPIVTITDPQNGATVSTERIHVRGTVTGDPVSATIDGAPLPLNAGVFDAEVALEIGPNDITIIALDAAGNSGVGRVEVTRGGGTLGIILNSPISNVPTNRRTTTVAGQVLSPAGVSFVTVNAIEIPIDAAGAFRKTDFALNEGQNVITATVRKNGAEGSVSATVIADFTAPVVSVRESGNPLDDESRFATRAELTVAATDGGQSLTPTLLIDAAPAVSPVTITANGGHTLVATARDAASNETRVERTFFIGGGATGGCSLTDFDPADGSLVTSDRVTLIGRTGGAPGVKVNGTAAIVSNNSFTATVNLPVEGANAITITCTDTNGTATGTSATLTLTRVTGAPSITITEPSDHSVTADEIITVRGTITSASDVVVNGAAATITGNTFTASNVRLSSGVNVVVARARNSAGRTATDSVQVTWQKNLPTITITSPTTALIVRTETLDVSGVWTNLDPASLTVTRGGTAAPALTTVTSDTTGTFKAASVPLTIGPQTITVRGLDRLGRATTATIDVTRADGTPSITITEPADNTFFGATAGAAFTVRGSFNADAAASVEVNGEVAVLELAASTFTAVVPFSSLLNTPVVARVTEPAGNFALDTIRVSKLGAAPRVVQTFPEENAVDVDAGTLPLVLFSAAMDRASVRTAFHLENAAGTAINGDVSLDRDVVTFAPAVLLDAGERYTIRIAAAVQDLAGNAMGSEFARSFTVVATAPATAPTLNAHATHVCGTLDLSGTAPADARLRIDLGTLGFNTTASATGAFTFTLPLSGRSGFQVARIRIVGSDGSLSAAAEAQFEVDCTGPSVTNATYDRNTNALTITFSKAIDLATVTTGANGSARLQLADGTIIGGTVSALAAASSISIVPAQNLTAVSFTLSITTAVKDTAGAALTAPYTRAFTTGEPTLSDGAGYISGEVFDADTGRPLPGATVSIEVPVGAFARRVGTQARAEEIGATSTVAGIADNRGRYLRELPEGAHTIRAFADGYTTVWRQIIVRAGVGVIPTDIRLTPRGATKNGDGGALVLSGALASSPAGLAASRAATLALAGENTPLTLQAQLTIPAGVVPAGSSVTLTAVGAQSLAGLLPLGWSPLASAEIASDAAALSGADLTFTVPAQTITTAAQTLTAVRYYDDRDEWRVITAVVTIAGDKATIPVATAGAYALVYPDKDPRLAKPANPTSGGALAGVADPCLADPNPCAPLAAKEALQLVPPVVLPTQRTVATLRIEGAGTALFPSGTAVQAYVDEELRLADGTRDVVAPFATDLLLYRNLAGDTGEAVFHLAPSARASEVVLEIGYDHIRIVPYPERIDRGALIGPEGGRVPADDKVAVEIPAGATTEALKATATSITDFASFGTIPGYRIVGGLALSLQWAAQGSESSPVELYKPARATFTILNSQFPILNSLILVEVLEGTPYGRIFRLASQITALEGGSRFSTKTIDRAVLPVDGIIRDGRYLLLAPDAPLAFATGTVHLGVGGPATANARVLTPTLGVVDLTRITGIFNVPVPAAIFSLVPRTLATGDGSAYTHPTAPAINAVVHVGALSIVAQPPTVSMTVFAHRDSGLVEVAAEGASGVTTSTSVKASFSPGLDAQSVRLDSIVVIDESRATVVPGRAVAQGSTGILWTLEPGTRLRADATYTAVVSPNVRGTNGTPLGSARAATFSTVSTLTSPNVDPSKIRITMPDANGQSQIIGAPGALKENWNAVAVRRGRDFSNRPQDTADAQRSFLIELGTGTDPNNRVTIADVIYLQIINDAGAVAAIVQLGPFTTADGRGFVARGDVETRYTTPDNITISVPAGAFEVPTVVSLHTAEKAAVADVPGFGEELAFHAGFKIDFEGIAKKRLDITFPTPATLPADKSPYLGYYGMSSQGPRIMLIDLLRRDGANLTTFHPEGSSVRTIGTQSIRSNAIVNPTILRDMLLGIDRGALIIGFTFQTSVNFITFAPPPVPADFFVPPIKSIYFASFAAERDRILVPVSGSGAFSILGIDPGTGLEVFNAPFSELGPGEPTSPVAITLPSTNEMGPYPVFASPGRAEVLSVDAEEFTDGSIRNIIASYDGSQVALSNAIPALPPDTRVEVINLRSADTVVSEDFASGGLSIAAKRGDRLLLLISDEDVDPASNLTVVFSEPLDTTVELKDHIKLMVRDPSIAGSTFQEVPEALVTIETNSGDRRVSVVYRGGFQRGKAYRIELRNTLRDLDTGGLQLRLGQRRLPPPPPTTPPTAPPPAPTGGPVPAHMHIDFSVRAPKGLVDTFNVSAGSVRDLAMVGNVLIVSALEGGIFAYDASNPMAMGITPPFAHIAPPVGNGQSWGLSVDLHGRLFATGVTPMYGVVRSYRMEELEACRLGSSCDDPLPNTIQRGNAIIAWRIGINVGMPLASMIIGGWPEAIPRKISVVTRDEAPEVGTFENLVGSGSDVGNGFRSGLLNLTASGGGGVYDKQRVTVINTTRDYRWSADVPMGGSVPVTVIGQPDDELRIVRNASTVGVVSLFGYGIGAYDLNAVDANYRHVLDPSWERLEDTYVLSDGESNGAPDCNKEAQAQLGRSCEIGSLKLSPDAALTIKGDAVSILALEQNRGLVHLTMTPSGVPGEAATFGRPGSMVFAERLTIPGLGRRWFGHPRLNQLRKLYQTASGREPTARYSNVAVFHRGGDTFALVTGYEYGVLVVKLESVMQASSLVDVIWIPSGAQSIRVSDANQLAVVVDGKGRVLLVNLAGIDESSFMGAVTTCTDIDCEWPLFPTAKAAITGASAGGIDVGADDPRIVWKSPDTPGDPLVFGTLAPIFDGDTGFVYTGSVTTQKMRVVSAVDPHVRFVGRTGVGTLPESIKRLNQIVPLGVKPATGSVAGLNGSLGAFQVQVLLPGSIEESLSGAVRVDLDTEPVIGVASPQLPEPLPRSRLRQTGSRAATGFELRHDGPEPGPAANKLRFQRGWNRMVTPWVVAIADPRAAKDFWPAGTTTDQKEKVGCFVCDRPDHLEGLPEPQVFELFTAGRIISAKAATASLTGGWEWLGQDRRLEARVNTVPADTLRPTEVVLPGHNPPVVMGAIQETYYAHSGELETASIDLNADGRAGVDVVLDRTYRSRTLGWTAFGWGWDSQIFQRIRPLPTGDAEVRDGMGNVWLFEKPSTGALVTYTAPKGCYLKLQSTAEGWSLFDAEWNITKFDRFGRMVSYSDRLVDADPASGNTIRYSYNGQDQLWHVADSYGRTTSLLYWTEADSSVTGAFPGKVRTVTDWRGRKVDYEYSDTGSLTTVRLPESTGDPTLASDFTFTGARRPKIEYVYDTTAGSATVSDRLELRTNLKSIEDPAEALKSDGKPRAVFAYDPSKRDSIKSETAALPECSGGSCGVVTFTYPGSEQIEVVDLLGQTRLFQVTLDTEYDKRKHLLKVVEKQVPVVTAVDTDLASHDKALVNESISLADLETGFKYDGEGEIKEIQHPNGLVTELIYAPRTQGAARQMVETIDQKQSGLSIMATTFAYYTKLREENIVRSITQRGTPISPSVTRDVPRPQLSQLTTTVTDEDTEVRTEHDAHGRPTATKRTAPGGGGLEQKTKTDYHDSGSPIALGLPNLVESGEGLAGGTSAANTYEVMAGAGYRIQSVDQVRGVTRIDENDAYGRLTLRKILGVGGAILAEERFGYDAEGRLLLHRRKQTNVGGDDVVSETYQYDLIGRPTEVVTDKANVNGAPDSVRVKKSYDIGNRTTTTYDPFVSSPGSFTLTQTDRLGRVERTERTGGSAMVRKLFGYDRQGSLAYETDGARIATLNQQDLIGRNLVTLGSDGTRATRTWDAWNQLTSVTTLGATGPVTPTAEVLGRTHFKYSTYGRTNGVAQGVSSGVFLTSRSDLSVDGQTEIVRLGQTSLPITAEIDPNAILRTTRTVRDNAGRVISQLSGEGRLPNLPADSTYAQTDVEFKGSLPQTVTVKEPRAGATYITSSVYDALGRAIEVHEASDAYVSTTSYDEAGNVVSSHPAGYPSPWANRYDSRGLLTQADAPEGKTTHHEYDARGVMRRYVDEAGKYTTYDTDGLGRVAKITYRDTTTEEMVYEDVTGQLASSKDRKGQWLSYFYDAAGRVTEVRLGGPRSTAPAATPVGDPYLRYTYDLGGRLRQVASRDAATEYEAYDLLGRPGRTRSIRYKNHGGLTSSAEILDAHGQGHIWTIYEGERDRWRMPAAGATLPATEPASAWRSWVAEEHDAASSITRQRAADGATATPGAAITSGDGRGFGRLKSRLRFYGNVGNALDQTYGYADGSVPGAAPGPPAGQLGRSRIKSGTFDVAGSQIERDDARRASLTTDFGLAGRWSDYGYDDRGRLETISLLRRAGGATPPTIETLQHADFRQARTVTTDSSDLVELGSLAPQFTPQSWTATQNDVHQFVERTLASEPTPRSYAFEGGRRTSDGSWSSQFDEEGRLTAIQRDSQRIEYTYNPAGRVVGRRALKQTSSGFVPEDRQAILDADGLPAETTWVWDPIVDRLVAIFEAGKSIDAVTTPAPDAGLVRQYVHSDQGYDDPVEVTVKRADGSVRRYLPLIDEAGTGSVQAILSSQSGLLAERVLYADAYGDAPRYLQGPVVDKIEVAPTKRGDGSIETFVVRVHLSETVDATTILSGLRVSALNAAGTVITSAVGAVDSDKGTVTMTIGGTEWTSLTTAVNATQLEIAVTNTLRAALWEGPVMPMPAWLLDGSGRASTTQFPVIQRETFASLTTFIGTIPNGQSKAQTLLAINNLYLAATPISATKLLTGFKAAPFVEPAAGLVFLRDRWYDPATGTFLTPDRAGTRDSSNLYAGFGLDPVNNSDPTGQCIGIDTVNCTDYAMDISDQFNNPEHWWGNTKRSFRFFGSELKGAALAVPRLAMAGWHIATHLPETIEGGKVLAAALVDDVPGMARRASNAIIDADLDKVGEFVGETLAFAGLGAATKTTQGAAALNTMKTVVGAGARGALRPVFGAIGRMPVITARGRRLTRMDKARRLFIQDTLTHPGVNYSPVGRMLKRAFPSFQWQQHHAVIQKAWYRIGGPNQWYPADRFANAGLRRLGDAGWNLVPIPGPLNNMLGRTSLGTAAFAGGLYGGSGYFAWDALTPDDYDDSE